jgi:hypothetical protein
LLAFCAEVVIEVESKTAETRRTTRTTGRDAPPSGGLLEAIDPMCEAKRPVREARHLLFSVALTAVALAIGLAAGPARAGCDKIPELTTQIWTGYQGSIDTVFGLPGASSTGSTPHPRDVAVGGQGCTAAVLDDKTDYVVTVLFKPPAGGTQNIVALENKVGCSNKVKPNCGLPGVHCVCGTDAGIVVNANNMLRFRFPDTMGFNPPGGFTGPATIAVLPSAGFTLPVALKNQHCQKAAGRPANLAVCIDEIFESDSCGTLDPTFSHFTALPPMNSGKKLCKTSNGKGKKCEDSATAANFTVDQAGNVLMPVRWEGVMKADPLTGKECGKTRKVKAKTKFRAHKNRSAPPLIPDNTFLASFSPRGVEYTPNFEPVANAKWLVLKGETDECESVLRISRRNCIDSGGGYTTKSCTLDTQCKNGETCGSPLFDFSDRLEGGYGPVSIPRSQVDATME